MDSVLHWSGIMKLYRVHQNLVSNLLRDIPAAVHAQLDAANLTIPKGEVAITAGSRGIANIATITKATGDWLKARGATPFIVPAMGSHNGATAAGQRAMIESLGITESAMAMEIRSSMDVVSLGRVATGEVFMDRHCFESAGVMVLNRIKLHTCFSGPVQSGIIKMMVVGMGKIQSATTFHETPTDQMKDMLLEMGRFIIDSGKLVGGVAILEDGLDETAEIHALAPDEVLQREPELLQKHQTYFPRLPVDNLDVLVVDEIGKTYSGTGMDTNVIGYRGVKHYEDLTTPVIRVIAALRLSPKSQGNAIGVGLADFITDGLRNAIDMPKTVVNALTTGDMIRAKLPVSLPTEADAIDMIRGRYGEGRWLFIPNTLHLETLFASEALRDELSAHPRCEVDPTPVM
ncbi:MAG: DUF2088 domain-containing protein, partial [Verrucomicrobia bacterium]|nr:DUF2088 domain-containing protein [Verrucomicrobiota bacterium]